jgi:hypothetical protein
VGAPVRKTDWSGLEQPVRIGGMRVGAPVLQSFIDWSNWTGANRPALDRSINWSKTPRVRSYEQRCAALPIDRSYLPHPRATSLDCFGAAAAAPPSVPVSNADLSASRALIGSPGTPPDNLLRCRRFRVPPAWRVSGTSAWMGLRRYTGAPRTGAESGGRYMAQPRLGAWRARYRRCRAS